jgi:hypothetical protein
MNRWSLDPDVVHLNHDVLPATVSHGWNTPLPTGSSQFHFLFDWTGTDDPSARLSVPAAIGTMQAMHTAD